jgi:hypothetical protein
VTLRTFVTLRTYAGQSLIAAITIDAITQITMTTCMATQKRGTAPDASR